ncbi:regulatory protein uhpC [Chlamydia ibidis]|uniref:Regulatory protein uhpC n=2 Tax=Chlamydia ibidis TaxID=1405396 RepID=S7J3S9_9CHLA|nr:MFS transporter [Chlamydia ibidis]EPP34873.1 regulatory protein uhpC [Chlamydia ibidis]EQM62862.1 regulatory protein uhpC [Chlamydia ibidis 10-1398/6]
MNIWTKFFQPPKHIKEIDDPELIKKQYKYWRVRIFYSMFLGYVFYYFTRKSFTFAMPTLISDLGFDKAQLGIIGSTLYITYGISKFVSGVMSDQSNPRYFMALGLIITGLTNIFFGCSSSILFFALWWGLNGWFQGWGWPPCARLLTHWYSKSERGTWWSIWSTSHNIGGALIPILTGFAIDYCGWRGAMFIPGVLCIGMGFILINRLRDTPQSLGLPAIEKYRKEQDARPHQETTADILEEEAEKELTTRDILFTYVLTNKWIWLLSFASFFIYIVRMAVNDWSALFLIETKNYTAVKANFCVSLFEIGGLFGMLLAGWLSDKLNKGKRGPMNVIFSLGLLFSILGMWYGRTHILWWLDGALLFTIGFFLFGPQMMIGLAAAELSHKKAAGTASGFAGWFAYFGAASSGYPLGKIAQDYGWQGFFLILLACTLLTLALFLPTWNASEKNLRNKG